MLYETTFYCALCDMYFPTAAARRDHIESSPVHPECDKCMKRFLHRNALRNHLTTSARHNYCSLCERDFRTPAGFRMHVEYAAVHRDDSDSEDGDYDEDYESGWEDELGAQMFPDERRSATETISDRELEEMEEDEFFEGSEDGISEEDPEEWLSADSVGVPLGRIADMTLEDTKGHSAGGPSSSALAPSTAPEITAASYRCPLCLDPQTNLSTTRCGHLFCTHCIHEALYQKLECPICRQPARNRDLRRTYLGC